MLTIERRFQYNTGMKTLMKPGKVDVLLTLFENVGDTYSVDQVCAITGIVSYKSLKATFSYIRRAKYVPDENRIDVRIKDGQCVRVN